MSSRQNPVKLGKKWKEVNKIMKKKQSLILKETVKLGKERSYNQIFYRVITEFSRVLLV